MTAAALLTQLSGLGVSAWADGAALRFKPASLVPPDVLADLRAHKAELLALLTAPDIQPAPEPETPPAEPIAEPWPDEGEAGIPRRYPGAVAGLLRASQCRPVSWTGAENRPPPGAWCRNCEYGRWWRGLGDGSGWRCWPCHPPDGAAPGTIEEVRT